MVESSLQTRVLQYLTSLPYCIAENVSGNAYQSGRADINGCIRGQSFRIELKIPTHRNKPTEKQLINLHKWEKAGSTVCVAYSLNFVRQVFTTSGINRQAPYFEKQEENGCLSWARIGIFYKETY